MHTTGEELLLSHFAGEKTIPGTWRVGLYFDGEVAGEPYAGDNLGDDDTYADITTEPTYDGPLTITHPDDFALERIENGGFDGAQGLTLVDVTAELSFDVTDASERVDAYYVSTEFRSDVLNQSAPRENLVWTGGLDDVYDLSADANDVFPLEGVRLGVE